jgi:hypothetical protein
LGFIQSTFQIVVLWCLNGQWRIKTSFRINSINDFIEMFTHVWEDIIKMDLTFADPCIIIQFKQINQPDATVLQVFLLDVLCRSTCFGRLHAHHQELTAALTVSGFTLERGDSSVVSRGRRPRLTTLLSPRQVINL